MGTNYFLVKNACEHCGRGDDSIHIGKSSAGWCFSLCVNTECQSLEDWKPLFQEHRIFDEYGDILDSEQMMKIITDRNWGERGPKAPLGYSSWANFYIENDASEGPHGLVRHMLDGKHCVGHGDGSWDLITGEFS